MKKCPICGSELINDVCPKGCITISRTMKTKPILLVGEIIRSEIDIENRTVPISFSSEEPVENWFGMEILDHSPGAMIMDRAKNGLPFTVNHNQGDVIGRAEGIHIGNDRRGRAVARFGKSERANEIFQDVQDEIRKEISVRAIRREMVLEKKGDGKSTIDLYRTLKWMPYEVAIVTVPADPTVGINRSMDAEFETTIIERKKEEHIMDKCPKCGADLVNGVCPKGCEITRSAAPAQSVDVNAVREDANKVERQRISEIDSIGENFGLDKELIRKHIQEGTTVDEFRKVVLNEIKTKAKPISMPALNEKEQKQYSIVRALRVAAGLAPRDAAGFEYEISDTIGRAMKKGTDGIFIPTGLNVFPEVSALVGINRAGLDTVTTSPANTGGYTVQTTVMPLIELLRNKLLVKAMGAQVLSLRNPVAFPRQSGTTTLYWTAENPGSDTGDSQAAFEQLLLTPKTAIANTMYSKQLLMESSIDVENFVRNDLTLINALGLDLSAINGGGGTQLTGILQTSGIGSVVGGDSGLAPAWSHIVGLETEVAIDNADFGSLGYLTNPKVRGKLKQTLKAANVSGFIWENGQNGFGEMNGYRAGATNQVPSNLTKGGSTGVCSAIIFGNWAELILAEFGVIEIIVDPYTKKKQAMIEVTSTMFCDGGVRHAEAFSAMKDALTT